MKIYLNLVTFASVKINLVAYTAVGCASERMHNTTEKLVKAYVPYIALKIQPSPMIPLIR